ncbi:MAG: HAD-IA family hydrolase [Bacilli bacterium]|nr:HAD-IA family hydrolase [Bacilli bacterium]MBQ9731445.1 HAD-IA family hydrolase [Bacilli bacterium]
MYKGVIFDLDGTLLNTLGDLTSAVNHVCNEYGYKTRTVEEVRSFIGNGIRNLISRVVPGGYENPRFEEMMTTFKVFYAENVAVLTHPYENVLKILKILKDKEYKIAIVSNKRHELVNKLNDIFFEDLINIVLGEDESKGIKKKPNSMMIDIALEKMGLDCNEVLYVGDSNVDKQTADNANLDCCLVSYGFRDKEELKELNAKYLIDDINDLLEIVING